MVKLHIQFTAMKNIIVAFISLLLSTTFIDAQKAPLSANEIMSEAFATAKKENKKVLVMFHASWCGWCHKMDTSINDPSIKNFFEKNFVIRHLVVFESKGKENLENPGALDMYNKYSENNQGIPFWLIFDNSESFLADSRMPAVKNGKESLQNTGCPATKEEVDYLITVLKKTTDLKENELELIRNRFRRNEGR